MKLTLSVTEHDKEPYFVTTNLAVMIAWERKFKRKAPELGTAMGYEDLAFMAWESAKLANIPVPPSFDGFIGRLSALDVVFEEDANPTRGDQQADS